MVPKNTSENRTIIGVSHEIKKIWLGQLHQQDVHEIVSTQLIVAMVKKTIFMQRQVLLAEQRIRMLTVILGWKLAVFLLDQLSLNQLPRYQFQNIVCILCNISKLLVIDIQDNYMKSYENYLWKNFLMVNYFSLQLFENARQKIKKTVVFVAEWFRHNPLWLYWWLRFLRK